MLFSVEWLDLRMTKNAMEVGVGQLDQWGNFGMFSVEPFCGDNYNAGRAFHGMTFEQVGTRLGLGQAEANQQIGERIGARQRAATVTMRDTSEISDSPGSISIWIQRLQDGQDDAVDAIWHRYHQRLLRVASSLLPSSARQEADEEDIVSGTFHSFFRRVQQGSFTELEDRNELWHLLSRMARRKAINMIRHQRRQKRCNDLQPANDAPPPMDQFHASTPAPQWSLIEPESIRELLGTLDEGLREIAVCRLQGFTNQEIAAQIRRSVPTVERRLRLIRQQWEGATES